MSVAEQRDDAPTSLTFFEKGWRVFEFDDQRPALIWEHSSNTLLQVPRFVISALKRGTTEESLEAALREIGMR